MTTNILRNTAEKVAAGGDCIHCYGSGCVYDSLEDEAHECWMCLGTGRKMDRTERIMLRAELEHPSV